MKSFHCIHGMRGEGSYKMKLEKILRNIMALEMGISLHPEFREHLLEKQYYACMEMHLSLIKTESPDKILWDTLYRNLKSDVIDEN